MGYEPLREKPILPGTAETDYERYLHTDELLALQKTAAERNHPEDDAAGRAQIGGGRVGKVHTSQRYIVLMYCQ